MYNEIIHTRIESLRKGMKNSGIDYYLITTADFHSSEYVSDYFKCREFFSGFTGSNGDLLVWQDGAALWTDGRYFLQAEEELSGTGIRLMKMGEKNVPTVEEFLLDRMLPCENIGVDGRCIPLSRGEALQNMLHKVDAKACMDAENPNKSKLIWNIDLAENIWHDRPALPAGPAWLLSKETTGKSRSERLEKIREAMKKSDCDSLVISSLDDIAWLLLLRGGDIEYNPVALSYFVLQENKAYLYINPAVLNDEVRNALAADGISVCEYNSVYSDLQNNKLNINKALIDPNRLSYALYMSLKVGAGEEKLVKDTCPTILPKACKTDAEISGEKLAHIRDGVAVTKFLHYLDNLRNSSDFLNGKSTITELDLAETLLDFRKAQEGFLDQSFAPIIATGPHGAIIHYEPDEKSNAVIEKDAFLLMDTGAQFNCGTTDITRTVVMGTPTEEMKLHYTAVLRGNLNLAAAVFREGTTGTNLDILARKPLWDLGMDYRHGTGHGVGFILNVHEGPQNISQKSGGGKPGTAFRPGMITSDEPGLYLDGKYGIRIENMMVCVAKSKSEYGEFYGFETLTMVPFDRAAIEPALLSAEELCLLNDYHKKVYENISPYLTESEKDWLKRETAPL